MSAGTKITRKGETLIAALLTESTHAAAAVKAGVSEATVQRWLKDPTFQAAYRTARRGVVEVAVGRLQQVTAEAVEALRKNLTCGNPAVEVRAAIGVLDQAFHGIELIDLATQLDELQRRLEPNNSNPPPVWGPIEVKVGGDARPDAI